MEDHFVSEMEGSEGFRSRKREGGMTLLVAAFVLILVSMLALASMGQSQSESAGGARSRASTRAFYAADAGVELALNRLAQNPPLLDSIDLDIADKTNIQSRSRSEVVPQPLDQVGIGENPEGWAVTVGTGTGYTNRVYRINITATAGGSTTEVEAKLVRGDAEAVGY